MLKLIWSRNLDPGFELKVWMKVKTPSPNDWFSARSNKTVFFYVEAEKKTLETHVERCSDVDFSRISLACICFFIFVQVSSPKSFWLSTRNWLSTCTLMRCTTLRSIWKVMIRLYGPPWLSLLVVISLRCYVRRFSCQVAVYSVYSHFCI